MKRITLALCLFFLFTGSSFATILNPGQGLGPNQRIYSDNSKYFAQMQADGNFVVYTSSDEPLWSTQTMGLGANWAVMQSDGNFVLYNQTTGKAIWSSKTNGNEPGYAAITDYGQWIVYKTTAVWSSNTSDHTNPVGANATVFGEGFSFTAGDVYYNGNYGLTYQTDGNIVVYNGSKAIWNSGTSGRNILSAHIMQSRLIAQDNKTSWFMSDRANLTNVAWTDGYLLFQADGNLIIYVPQSLFASPSKYAPVAPPQRTDRRRCYGPVMSCIGSTMPIFTYRW